MPSDLQVSNIKDLTGSNTGLSIASDGQVTISQNNPTITLGSNATVAKSGMVLKVESVFSTAQTGCINNSENAVLTIDFQRVSASSHFVLYGNLYVGAYSTSDNQDSSNITIRLKENNAGAGLGAVTVNSNLANNGFYYSDVPAIRTSVTYNGIYDTFSRPFGVKRSISGDAGTTINFEIILQAGTTASTGVYLNRSNNNSSSGGTSFLTIMEVLN